ncbi:MAG: hypothetical protein IT289_06810 [Oligoflexia bacterium]|nr:hypothetical protein [Oligoflexia bacterium]
MGAYQSGFRTWYFDFYGVRVRLDGELSISDAIWTRFEKDFGIFLSSVHREPRIHIVLRVTEDLPVLETRRTSWTWKGCRVTSAKACRQLEYKNYGVIKILTHPNWRFDISAKTQNAAYELTYDTIHGSVGEALEDMGFFRVHAAAFGHERFASLVVLGSGKGKTALSFLQLWNSKSVLSDEQTLIHNHMAYPYLTHLSLSESLARALGFNPQSLETYLKRLYPSKHLLWPSMDRPMAPLPVQQIIYCAGFTSHPVLTAGSRIRAFWALFISGVVGQGLIQLVEWRVRRGALLSLLLNLIKRFYLAIRLTANCQPVAFFMSRDAFLNFQALKAFNQGDYGKISPHISAEIRS